jgi:FMN phosphatase YigB (HAD superfamily)
MPFVSRNGEGHIVAVFDALQPEAMEELTPDNEELRLFLGQENNEWMRADLELARVTEDLIDTLIDKGVIMFTDLPDAAQHKLLKRQGLRNRLDYVSQLFTLSDEEDGVF